MSNLSIYFICVLLIGLAEIFAICFCVKIEEYGWAVFFCVCYLLNGYGTFALLEKNVK